MPFGTDTKRIRCALCDDPNADWPNNEEGRERFKEHAAAKHKGQKEYIVV